MEIKNKGGRPETHGFRRRGSKRPKEYVSWDHMIGRCHRPNHTRYPYYGAKGVIVCGRWRNSYADFFTDMGKAPSKKHTLDRYPNKKGNYEPGNVRWATPKQQARNTNKNVFITHNGETLCAAEWAERLGLWPSTILNRAKAGRDISVSLRGRNKVRRITISTGKEKIFDSINDAAKAIGVSRASVANVIYGVRESSFGYYWSYVA